MYARFMAGGSGDFLGTEILTSGYENFKYMKFLLGQQKDLRVSQFDPVPPSEMERIWGRQGIIDGLIDFKRGNRSNLWAQWLGGRPLSTIGTEWSFIMQKLGGAFWTSAR